MLLQLITDEFKLWKPSLCNCPSPFTFLLLDKKLSSRIYSHITFQGQIPSLTSALLNLFYVTCFCGEQTTYNASQEQSFFCIIKFQHTVKS